MSPARGAAPSARAVPQDRFIRWVMLFVALVLSNGRAFLAHQAGFAVAVDIIWVVVFAAYLLRASKPR